MARKKKEEKKVEERVERGETTPEPIKPSPPEPSPLSLQQRISDWRLASLNVRVEPEEIFMVEVKMDKVMYKVKGDTRVFGITKRYQNDRYSDELVDPPVHIHSYFSADHPTAPHTCRGCGSKKRE